MESRRYVLEVETGLEIQLKLDIGAKCHRVHVDTQRTPSIVDWEFKHFYVNFRGEMIL